MFFVINYMWHFVASKSVLTDLFLGRSFARKFFLTYPINSFVAERDFVFKIRSKLKDFDWM